MLKLLIDECIPYRVVKELRKQGFDVLSAAEDLKSAEDLLILKIASRGKRILLTNDKDFGEMVYRNRLKGMGVVLLRLADDSFENTLKSVLKLFARFGKTLKQSDLIVVAEKSIRIRSF